MGVHEFFGQLDTQLGIVDVQRRGAKGDGVTDDTAAIQAALNASTPGQTIWFPPGTYLVSATLRFPGARMLLGPGGRAAGAVIKAKAGLTGGAVLAALGWYNSATTCDAPVKIQGLQIDASNVANVHGLVIFNFWSHVEDVQVCNISGASACGMLVTDWGRDQATITTNSHSENTFVRCRFYDHAARATGLKVETHTNPSRTPPDGANQDGHVLDSFFSNITGDGIRIQRAAGWSIENNHLYGIGYNAIALANCYATKVMRNYVEDFGGADGANNGAAPTYGYFSGIALESVLDSRASILTDNTVSVVQPSSPTGNRWSCYTVRAGAGQLRAHLVMADNAAVWASAAPATNRSWAYWLGEPGDTGRMLHLSYSNNEIESVQAWAGTRSLDRGSVNYTDCATSNVTSVAANITLTDEHDVVIIDSSAAARTATLPTPVGRKGKRFLLKKLGGTTANPVTIATAAGTIDGGATEVMSVAGGFRELISDGANWQIIGGKIDPVIITAGTAIAAGGTISIDASVGTVYRFSTAGNATLAVPTNPIDSDTIAVEILPNAAGTLTISGSILLTTGLSASMSLTSGKRTFLGLRFVNGVGWFLLAASQQL